MKTVILCGGMGTRSYPFTRRIPKALMPVAGLPILEQVMRIYASQGFDEFVLAVGYLKNDIRRYFAERPWWQVEILDTGDHCDTGERVRRCLDHVDEWFFATYCDGLGDVDLRALARRHAGHDGSATVTATPLRSQYGVLQIDDDERIVGFVEKPTLGEHWINAGFFCFERSVFETVPGENLERDILPAVASSGQLHIHRHTGFWRSMDTFKDQLELDVLWAPYSAALDEQAAARPERPTVVSDWLTRRYQLVRREA